MFIDSLFKHDRLLSFCVFWEKVVFRVKIDSGYSNFIIFAT